jgi:RimJ/RimL family protein N-acetyltransferase
VHDVAVLPSNDAAVDVQPFHMQDATSLTAFLAEQDWPFHGTLRETPAEIQERIDAGYYTDGAARTFWIVVGNERVGMLRLFDLEDETPMFDLRIDVVRRGNGFGTAALKWLTNYVFNELPSATRIEGTTRQDNAAMRRTFEACGFAKEAHYRDAWPDAAGRPHDAVGYSILRRDWSTGTVTAVDWND